MLEKRNNWLKNGKPLYLDQVIWGSERIIVFIYSSSIFPEAIIFRDSRMGEYNHQGGDYKGI
jgi:hypothetical protein